ncbi:hypothetical protein AN641_08200 [Candidatus Epulonipiscioides gigas]|nr:hypothetical protein AN641_08200 [Epulopiscium sp. SCG-C07WGA-EpuloA2]
MMFGYTLKQIFSGLIMAIILTLTAISFVVLKTETADLILWIGLILLFIAGFILGYKFYKSCLISVVLLSLFFSILYFGMFFISVTTTTIYIISTAITILFGLFFARHFKLMFILMTSLEGAILIVSSIYILLIYGFSGLYSLNIPHIPLFDIILISISILILTSLGFFVQYNTSKKFHN